MRSLHQAIVSECIDRPGSKECCEAKLIDFSDVLDMYCLSDDEKDHKKPVIAIVSCCILLVIVANLKLRRESNRKYTKVTRGSDEGQMEANGTYCIFVKYQLINAKIHLVLLLV